MTLKETSPVMSTRGDSFTNIKSHSSMLSNERVGILFYQLDQASIALNQHYTPESLVNVKATLYQIYKNIRCLLRDNWYARNALQLETKVPGIYTLDVAFEIVEEMIAYCMSWGYTVQKVYQIGRYLNKIEIVIRDILQYFNYFYRPDYKGKPDIELAAEEYKRMADKMTIEQLKTVVGKNHKIDFERLGVIETDEKKQQQIGFEENED